MAAQIGDLGVDGVLAGIQDGQNGIEQGVFKRQMTYGSIEETVKERVDNYDEPNTNWYEAWLRPTLRSIDLKCISWEDVTEYILSHDPTFGESLSEFYSHCLKFNRPQDAVTHR